MLNSSELTDKLILFLACFVTYVFQSAADIYVVPLLITIITISLLSYFDIRTIRICIFVLFLISSLLNPDLNYFIPLLFYDFIGTDMKLLLIFLLIPMLLFYEQFGLTLAGSIWVVCTLAVWGKYRTLTCLELKLSINALGDNARELSEQLKNQNKKLLGKMDLDISLATLKERNRIAREIHDNVGHQLSSSILQIGALMTFNDDPKIGEALTSVNVTLSEAMGNIRDSVHDLHDQSVDLHMQISGMVDKFSFCQVNFNDEIITQPDKRIKLAFISIAKEALSNIIKHSDATGVDIVLREHPAFYQFIIRDNGTIKSRINDRGMGLLNMIERIQTINGNINFRTKDGFEIFISVPKEVSL